MLRSSSQWGVVVGDVTANVTHVKDSFDPLKGKILKIQPCNTQNLES